MNSPDGKPKDTEQFLEEEFRFVVREYLQKIILKDGDSDLFNRMVSMKKLLADEVIYRVVEEEKIRLMDLPESMNISDKAYARLDQRWADSPFEFTDLQRLNKSGDDRTMIEIDALAKEHDHDEYLANVIADNNSGLIIYRQFGGADAFTAFRDIHDLNGDIGIEVALQIKEGGSADNAGIGIAMLERLIKAIKYNAKSARFIVLCTRLKPSGLGNLGFKYEKTGYISTFKYRYDFEEKDDQEASANL